MTDIYGATQASYKSLFLFIRGSLCRPGTARRSRKGGAKAIGITSGSEVEGEVSAGFAGRGGAKAPIIEMRRQ